MQHWIKTVKHRTFAAVVLHLEHLKDPSTQLCTRGMNQSCQAYLYLCEGEGCNLCGDGEANDGPAIAVGHMKLVQAGLYLVQGVVQGV